MKTRTYHGTLDLDLEREGQPTIEIRVHYTYTPGTPDHGPTYASGGWPGDPPEAEITKAERADTGAAVTLTEAEEEKILEGIYDDPPDWRDEGPDPDDERDAREDREDREDTP
jgi:hypothetical protein